MFDRIYSHQWLQLSQDTKNKLVDLFNIERTGGTEVIDNTVVSDGYTNNDLAVITIEALQKYTGNNSSEFIELWNEAMNKVKGLPQIQIDETEPVVEENDLPIIELPVDKKTKK